MAIDPIQLILQTIESSPEVLESLGKRLDDLEKIVERINKGYQASGQAGEESHKKVKKSAEDHKLTAEGLVIAYEKIHLAFELIKQVGEKAFESLIQQNIELRQQIQSTSAQLVSNQDVLVGGKVVKDTLAAIQAAGQPVQEQIQKLRQDALQVSGVTSADLVGSFEALSQATGTLKINLSQAETLAVRLTAQGTTLGLSAQQINSEVQAIGRGEINNFNVIAKSLHLKNENLATLAAEGKLYDYIYERTQAGVEGQKISAASYAGVTSNIKEVIQLVTQAAGAPLLDAILKQLTSVYQFLSANQEGLTEFAKTVGEQFADVIDTIGEVVSAFADALTPAFNNNKEAGKATIDLLIGGFKSFAGLVQATAPTVGALVSVVGEGYSKIVGLIELVQEKFAQYISFVSKIPGINQAVSLATGGLVKGITDPIKDAGDALKIYSDQADGIATKGQAIEEKIAAAKKLGKDLTADQLKENQKLGDAARLHLGDIDAQLKLLKQTAPVTAEQRQQQEAKINLLRDQKTIIEGQLKDLKGASAETTFQNKTLDKIGNTYEQLASKAKAAKDDIANTNDADKAGQRAKDFVDLTKQQIELGAVSREQAIKDLEAIANNEGLKVEARQNAQKAIDDIRKKGQDQEKADLDTQLATVEGAIKVGRLDEVQGAEEVTKLKKKELDKQLEFVEAEIAREQALKEAQVKEQLAGIDTQITALQKAKQDALAKGDKDAAQKADTSLVDLEKQKTTAQASLQIDGDRVRDLKNQRQKLSVQSKVAEEEGEERIQAAKLAVLERAQKKAEDTVKLSQIKQETEVQKLLNSRAIRQTEAEELRVKEKQKFDQQELELEQKKTAALEKQPKLNDPVKEAQRQEQIRASRIRTAELTEQLAKDEFDRQQAAFKVFSEAQDRQAQAAKNAIEAQVQPLQAEIQLQDALSKSLEAQNKLIEARKDLQASLTGYVQGELAILSQTAKSDRDKKSIAELTAAIKLRSLQQEQEIAQQVLELNLQQEQAALRKEKIQNRINQFQNIADQAQARADLAKAKADPNATPEAIEAAQENLRAKQGAGLGLQLQGALLEQSGQEQEQLAGFRRQSLANQQAQQRDQARADLIATLPKSFQTEALNNLQRDTLGKLGLSLDSLAQLAPIVEGISQAARQPGGVGNFGLGNLNPVARSAQVQQSAEVDRLSKQLEDFSKGGEAAADASVKKLVAQLPQLSNSDSKAQESRLEKEITDGNLSPAQVEAKQKTIDELREKRTQLVQDTGSISVLEDIERNTKATAVALGTDAKDLRHRSIEDELREAINPKPRPDRATATLPPVPGRNTAAAAAARNGAGSGITPLGGGITVNMTNQITNHITGEDVQNGTLGRQTEQQVLNALYNVATVARNQKGSQATK